MEDSHPVVLHGGRVTAHGVDHRHSLHGSEVDTTLWENNLLE